MTSPEALAQNSTFYNKDDPELDPQAVQVLTEYSGIAPDQLAKHVRNIRDKAWEKNPYPCIGLYKFLEFGLVNTKQYKDVLARVKAGDTIIDVGCCFGHCIRKLVFDGAPQENVYGLELDQNYLDLGYELFNDRGKLRSELKTGDIFAPDPVKFPQHSYDIVLAGAIFHLFNWDEQVSAMSNTVRLLKPKRGSMIFGRQTGVEDGDAGEIQFPYTLSGSMYRHSPATFKKMVEVVAEKTRFKLESSVDPPIPVTKMEDNRDGFRLLAFCIVVQ